MWPGLLALLRCVATRPKRLPPSTLASLAHPSSAIVRVAVTVVFVEVALVVRLSRHLMFTPRRLALVAPSLIGGLEPGEQGLIPTRAGSSTSIM